METSLKTVSLVLVFGAKKSLLESNQGNGQQSTKLVSRDQPTVRPVIIIHSVIISRTTTDEFQSKSGSFETQKEYWVSITQKTNSINLKDRGDSAWKTHWLFISVLNGLKKGNDSSDLLPFEKPCQLWKNFNVSIILTKEKEIFERVNFRFVDATLSTFSLKALTSTFRKQPKFRHVLSF